MSNLQPFTGALIAECLRDRGVKFMTDDEGACLARFGSNNVPLGNLDVWLSPDGSDRDIFLVRAIAEMEFSEPEHAGVTRICNEWNSTRRWPKAYLRVDDDGGSGQVFLEEQLLIRGQGISKELVITFFDVVIATSLQFWEWALQEKLIGHLAADDARLKMPISTFH